MVACAQILYRAGTGILPAPHGGISIRVAIDWIRP
jgi:hypothetical protein